MVEGLEPEEIDDAYRAVLGCGSRMAEIVLLDLMDVGAVLKFNGAQTEIEANRIEGSRQLVIHILTRAGLTLTPSQLPANLVNLGGKR